MRAKTIVSNDMEILSSSNIQVEGGPSSVSVIISLA